MLKKGLPLLIVVVLLLSLAVGCGTGTVTPIEVVPQKATLLATLDLTVILEHEDDLAEFAGSVATDPESQQAMADVLEILDGLEEAMIFGDISGTDQQEDYMGFIVKGTFVENELVAEIESAADEVFSTIEYKGYDIYTDPFETTAIAFLSGDAFVFGPMQPVKDVISVKEGDQSAVTGKVLDAYNGLADAQLKMAMLVPAGMVAGALEGMTGELPIQLPGLEGLADLETVGITASEEDDLVSFGSELCFTSSDSAEDVEGLIGMLGMLIGMVPDLPPEAQGFVSLLENLEVVREAACVDISLELTTTEIEALMQSLVQSAGTVGGFPAPPEIQFE